MASPFEVLQVDPDADDAEVERAYRRRVLEAHPDHGGSTSEFQRIRAAYESIQAGYEPDEHSDDGPRGNGAATGTDGESGAESASAPETSRVEYLNYEVLADHGWTLGDDDLFEAASAAGLDPVDYGEFLVEPDETLLEAAEHRGFAWPYACRGGACANCAVALVEGEMETPGNHILSSDLLDRGIRLSCLSAPESDELRVVYNVKHLPELDELRLPPDPFERAQATD